MNPEYLKFKVDVTLPNIPPDVSGAVPSVPVLGPPNHALVPVTITGVTDPNGDPVTITITAITQDEVVYGPGKDASPDGAGIGTHTAWVKAERDGNGDGRVYRIAFLATDGNGGRSSGSVFVAVPHDQGAGAHAVDSGQRYNSAQP